MTRSLMFVLSIGACIAVCTTISYAQPSRGVSGALTQPFRDVGFIREEPADVLKRAAAAPYAAPNLLPAGGADCAAFVSEIASLDTVLGPDVDAPRAPNRPGRNLVSGAVSSAINGVIGLPYRGVIRRLSGAERRDRVMQEATQAGMVRRAFLKGLRERDCPATPPASPPTQMLVAQELTPQPTTAPATQVTLAAAEPTPEQIIPASELSAPQSDSRAGPAPQQTATLETVADVTPVQ